MRAAFLAAAVLSVAMSGAAWAKGGSHAHVPRGPASGSKHEEPHGGTFQGGSGGSSHKGGTYKSPDTGDHYRKHKP